jgi:hypothetical protein
LLVKSMYMPQSGFLRFSARLTDSFQIARSPVFVYSDLGRRTPPGSRTLIPSRAGGSSSERRLKSEVW